MRWGRAIGLLVGLVVVVAACGEAGSSPSATYGEYPPVVIDEKNDYSVVFTTSLGRMTFMLLADEAPLAVNNVVFLAQEGFYDGLTFHRVLPGVLAETGDPTGTGNGGPGYAFEIEPPQRPYERGVLVMANSGAPNSNGSRFFIILGDVTTTNDLPGEYTVFGHIKEGHSPSERTLEKIEAVALGPAANGEVSVPQEPIELLELKANLGCATAGNQYGGGWAGGGC